MNVVRNMGIAEMGSYKFAIVVGANKTHEESLAELLYAESDAKKVAAVLRDEYGFFVTELIGPNASVKKIRDALRQAANWNLYADDNYAPQALRAPMADDLFLFYYSGHGATQVGAGAGYSGLDFALCPSNGQDEQEKSLSIYSLQRHLFNDVPCRHCICIFDACRSLAASPEGNKGGQGEGLSKNVATLTHVPASIQKRIETFWGCGLGQYSWESTMLEQSVMSHHLLNVLQEPHSHVDSQYDHYRNCQGISFRQVFECTAQLVADWTRALNDSKKLQDPRHESSHTTPRQLYLLEPYTPEEAEPPETARWQPAPFVPDEGAKPEDQNLWNPSEHWTHASDDPDEPEDPAPAAPRVLPPPPEFIQMLTAHIEEIKARIQAARNAEEPILQALARIRDQAQRVSEACEDDLESGIPQVLRDRKNKVRRRVERQLEQDPAKPWSQYDLGESAPANPTVKQNYIILLRPAFNARKAYEEAQDRLATKQEQILQDLQAKLDRLERKIVEEQKRDMLELLSGYLLVDCRTVDDLDRNLPMAVTTLAARYPGWPDDAVRQLIEELFYPEMYGKDLQGIRRYSQAHFDLCNKYAQKKVPDACFDLAMCYIEGSHTSQKPEQPLLLLAQAAEHGHAAAMLEAARQLLQQGPQCQPHKAAAYLRRFVKTFGDDFAARPRLEQDDLAWACRQLAELHQSAVRESHEPESYVVSLEEAIEALCFAYERVGDGQAGIDLSDLHALHGEYDRAQQILVDLMASGKRHVKRKARGRLPFAYRLGVWIYRSRRRKSPKNNAGEMTL